MAAGERRTYVVFRQFERVDVARGFAWQEAGRVEASNSDTAIRMVVRATEQPGGYMAIPERMVKVAEVGIQQRLVVTLNGETAVEDAEAVIEQ